MCANVLNGGHITSKQPDAQVRIIDERRGVMTCIKQARHGLSVIADDEDLTRALEKFGMVEHGCCIERFTTVVHNHQIDVVREQRCIEIVEP